MQVSLTFWWSVSSIFARQVNPLLVFQTFASLHAATPVETSRVWCADSQRVRQNAAEGRRVKVFCIWKNIFTIQWAHLILHLTASDKSLRAVLEILLPPEWLGQLWGGIRGRASPDPQAVLGDLWITGPQGSAPATDLLWRLYIYSWNIAS